MKVNRRVSVTEVEYWIKLSNGAQYDVLLEVGYDRRSGYYHLSSVFKPGSLVRISTSSLPLDLRCELAEQTQMAFSHYLNAHIDLLEKHFFVEAI